MTEEKAEYAQEDIKASLLNELSDPEKREWEAKWEQWQNLFWEYGQSDFYADQGIKEFLKWIQFIEITKSNKEQVRINLERKIKKIKVAKKIEIEGLSLERIESYFNALKKLIELKDEVKFNLNLLIGYTFDITEYIKLLPLLMYAEKYPNPNVVEIKRFARFFLNITRFDIIFKNPYYSIVNVILLTNLFLERGFTDIANITYFVKNYKMILSDEEIVKLSIYKQSSDDLRKEIEDAFWEAEDYKFCDGKISFVLDCIDFEDISTFDAQKLSDFKDCFNNFKTLFDNPTDLLRRALLTKGDYTVWEGYSTSLKRNRFSFINRDKSWKEQLSSNNKELYKSLIKDFGDRKKTNNKLTTDDILNQIITDFLNNKTEKNWIYYFVKEESLLKDCKEKSFYWCDSIESPSPTSPEYLFYLRVAIRMREEKEGGLVEKLQAELNSHLIFYRGISRRIGKLVEIFTEIISKNGIKHEYVKEFTEVIEELSESCDSWENSISLAKAKE
jgi:hypothetical protein